MIAKTKDGMETFRNSKIYMPYPARFGRTDKMGRGPYEKSGMIRDTGLPPLRTVHETFEIEYPYKDVQEENHSSRKLLANAMDVEVKLLYLPFGERNQDHFIWKIVKCPVTIE